MSVFTTKCYALEPLNNKGVRIGFEMYLESLSALHSLLALTLGAICKDVHKDLPLCAQQAW